MQDAPRRGHCPIQRSRTRLAGLCGGGALLFGSHARDEAAANSDIDVFVDVAPDASFGLQPYMGTFRVLEDAFDRKLEIGYSTRGALSPYIRTNIKRDALRVF
ncbi:MAG: nucleotidyltransferase domain-containing protein [bacterium]|nr:nucleotidyltransferase domain-containing protein [bacterium]